jgi:hypothetical protein
MGTSSVLILIVGIRLIQNLAIWNVIVASAVLYSVWYGHGSGAE